MIIKDMKLMNQCDIMYVHVSIIFKVAQIQLFPILKICTFRSSRIIMSSISDMNQVKKIKDNRNQIWTWDNLCFQPLLRLHYVLHHDTNPRLQFQPCYLEQLPGLLRLLGCCVRHSTCKRLPLGVFYISDTLILGA